MHLKFLKPLKILINPKRIKHAEKIPEILNDLNFINTLKLTFLRNTPQFFIKMSTICSNIECLPTKPIQSLPHSQIRRFTKEIIS